MYTGCGSGISGRATDENNNLIGRTTLSSFFYSIYLSFFNRLVNISEAYEMSSNALFSWAHLMESKTKLQRLHFVTKETLI